ncbi:MAG: hypothetical protein AAFX87_10220 [Bacteroidota bacterium]
MTDLIGYIALGIALLALSKKKLLTLKWWHLTSSALYIIYGTIISAWPVVVGAVLYCSMHIYHLVKHYRSNKDAQQA